MTWLPCIPWLDVYLWGLKAAVVTQAAFVVVFATTEWRRYRTGRALFLKSAVIAVLLGLSLAGYYRSIPHLVEIGAALMWLMEAAVLYLLWSVVRQKWLDHRDR